MGGGHRRRRGGRCPRQQEDDSATPPVVWSCPLPLLSDLRSEARDWAKLSVDEAMLLLRHRPPSLRGAILELLSEECRDDRGIVEEVVSRDGMALRFVSDRLRGDVAVAHLAANDHGQSLRYTLSPARNDHRVVLAAVASYGLAIRFAPSHLRDDPSVLMAAAGTGGYSDALLSAGPDVLEDTELVAKIVGLNNRCYGTLPERLQQIPEVYAQLRRRR